MAGHHCPVHYPMERDRRPANYPMAGDRHQTGNKEPQTPEEGEIIDDAPLELYEVNEKNASYINGLDSNPHKVQLSRKQKRSNEYNATDLHNQRKPGKRHRVSSSHDDEEVHVTHRGRWRPESILEESHKSHKQDDAYEMERGRYTSNLDDDRNGHFRDYQHGNWESSREDKSSYSGSARQKDGEQELAGERDRKREREREGEGDRDKGRERQREKAQYGEDKYEREREDRGRRKRDRESRGPSREDMDRYNDRSSRRRRSNDLDDDGHAYRRHKRRYETDIDRDRTADLLKYEKKKTEETENEKAKRDEVEQEDYQEKIAFQLVQQEEEEEELARIKEGSGRRRQAILERCKNQPSLKDQVTQSGDSTEVHVDQSTEKRAAGDSVLSGPIDGPINGADVLVDESTFSSGKSPLGGGHNADEKASGVGGLGQFTPEFSTEELVKKHEKKIECLQQQPQFSTEELVKKHEKKIECLQQQPQFSTEELSKQRENFEQHPQEHEDVVKQQLPTEELVKELAKQIEHLQLHQQKYTGQVKQQSERSADMFCDDIFGESPAAISKMVSV